MFLTNIESRPIDLGVFTDPCTGDLHQAIKSIECCMRLVPCLSRAGHICKCGAITQFVTDKKGFLPYFVKGRGAREVPNNDMHHVPVK